MKRIVCLLLALLMLSTSLVACGENDKPATTTADTGDAASTTEATESVEVPEVLTADFDEHEFNILSAGNQVFNDFDYEEESSIVLDNAQYKRKIKVEEDFNITVKEKLDKQYSSGSGPGYQAVTKQVNSGDCDYDLCLIAGYDVSVLAYNGYLYDMNSIPGLDLSKSWWDQNAIESLNVNNVVFFTTGEITVSDNRCAHCILVNKQLLEDYNLDSPYELVENGTWTIENFAAMCKTVSEDLNQDGVYNENDRYGLLVWDDSIVAMVAACGQRFATRQDDGTIALSWYNETTLDALAKYTDIAYNTQYALQYQRSGGTTANGQTQWQNNQALFWTSLIDSIPKIREMESDFGVLPYPKLSETQDNYYAQIAGFNSQFICVPLVQEDIERTGIITEALAYYGQKIVTPALYDMTLIGQGIRDVESEPMLEIIFDNLVYDFGLYYQVGEYNKQLIYKLRDRDANFTSMYDKYKSFAENRLKLINTYYANAVADWASDAQ